MSAEIDWGHWARMRVAPIWELVCLSLRLDPRATRTREQHQLLKRRLDETVTHCGFGARSTIQIDHTPNDGDLYCYVVDVGSFAAWAQAAWGLPQEFLDAIDVARSRPAAVGRTEPVITSSAPETPAINPEPAVPAVTTGVTVHRTSGKGTDVITPLIDLLIRENPQITGPEAWTALSQAAKDSTHHFLTMSEPGSLTFEGASGGKGRLKATAVSKRLSARKLALGLRVPRNRQKSR